MAATVSIMKACELAGVSCRTIYNWILDNKVQYVRTAGGSVRIFVDSLFKRGNVAPKVEPQPKAPRPRPARAPRLCACTRDEACAKCYASKETAMGATS